MRLTDTNVSRRWTFDLYGHGWRYLDPKSQRMVTARVNVTTSNKDPALFGIGAYVADGAILRQVGTLRYRFARWADFGAFLGTHADFGNDFARSSRIPFTMGLAVSEDDLSGASAVPGGHARGLPQEAVRPPAAAADPLRQRRLRVT